MAYLRRHRRSPYWVACFLKPDGHYSNRSTKTKDRRVAQRIAESWEEAGRNRLAENQARSVISDVYKQINGTSLVTPSFAEYSKTWIARKTVETRPQTLLSYKSVIANFQAFLGKSAAEPLHHLTPADVSRWRDETATRASARTANNKLKIIRVVFQSAWRDGQIIDNPAAKVTTLRAPESNRRPFTTPELAAVLKVATGEWKGIIIFGLYTGQRLKDIALLTWANLNLDEGIIRFSTSKTGRRQEIPVAPPVQAYLDTLPVTGDPQAPLFPHAHAIVTRNGTTAMLSQQFHRILAEAGLVPPRPRKHRKITGCGRSAKRLLSPLSFHSLRHTTTSLLKASGVTESVVRDIIGHESALVSRLYTHIGPDLKREAVRKLPCFTEASAAAR